jgi:hypothetical protein
MPSQVLNGFDAVTFEHKVSRVKLQILEFANARDLDSAHVAAAMADVLGMTAAKLDLVGNRTSLDDRLHSFTERAATTYRRALVGLGTKKTGT